MKRFLICLIAVAAITMLLVPSGKAYAFGCINYDDFSSPALDLAKWTVENFGECYDFEITDGGKLRVTKVKSPCDGDDRIYFIPNTSRQVRSISAEVTVLAGPDCHRARVLADPVLTRDGGVDFHQLALIEPRWDPCNYRFHCPDPGLSRYITSDPSLGLFDGIFRRGAFFGPEPGPWPPEQIIGKAYTLYLRVGENMITSRIIDKSTGRNLGTIRYTPPGGLKLRGHVLGLSCYGPEAGSSEVLYDNVKLCFW